MLSSERKATLKWSLFKGVSAHMLQFAVRTAEQFVLVPVFLMFWGAEIYKDWLVLLATVQILSLLDFGLQSYFSNHLRIAWSENRPSRFHKLIGVGIFLYGALTILALVVIILLSMVANPLDALRLSSLMPGSALWLFLLLAITVMGSVGRGFLGSIYQARGEVSRGFHMATALSILVLIGIISSLTLGFGPQITALIIFVLTIPVGYSIILYDLLHRYPDLSFRPQIVSGKELHDIASSSFLYFLPQAGQTLISTGPIILLGILAPASSAVIVYSISRTLSGVVRNFLSQMNTSNGVEMSRLIAEKNHDLANKLFRGMGRLMSSLAGILSGAIFAVAPIFLEIWTLGKVNFDPTLLATLLLAIVLTSPSLCGFSALHHNNRPGPLAIAFMAHAGAGTLLCLLLIPHFQATGAAISFSITEFFSVGLFVTIIGTRIMNVPLWSFYRVTLGAALVGLIASYIVTYGLIEAIQPNSMMGLISVLLLWICMAAPLTYVLGLNQNMRQWFYTKAIQMFTHQSHS